MLVTPWEAHSPARARPGPPETGGTATVRSETGLGLKPLGAHFKNKNRSSSSEAILKVQLLYFKLTSQIHWFCLCGGKQDHALWRGGRRQRGDGLSRPRAGGSGSGSAGPWRPWPTPTLCCAGPRGREARLELCHLHRVPAVGRTRRVRLCRPPAGAAPWLQTPWGVGRAPGGCASAPPRPSRHGTGTAPPGLFAGALPVHELGWDRLCGPFPVLWNLLVS